MTNPRIWSLSSAVSGVIVAVLLYVATDMSLSWVLIILGLWIIAGAAMRILVEYIRVRRRAETLADPSTPLED
ncbi:hypothetical protein ACNI3K_08050 [Demequina sp. SO4-13]|uniref:hypothetical protein n=1 Tax=Demequina sp. SO4-13 TaxID=3401027 RepID=UPI003AF72C5C